MVDDTDDWLAQAQAEVAAALAVCRAPGLVGQQRQMLEVLMACSGGERLAPLRDAMLPALA